MDENRQLRDDTQHFKEANTVLDAKVRPAYWSGSSERV